MEIKFHGHSCFELSEGETTVLVDPFLKPNNPAAVATAEEVEPDPHRDHPRPRRPHRRRGRRSRSAPAPTASRSSRSPTGSKRRASRTLSDPNLGGTVELRLGLDQARARLAHQHAPRLRRGALQRRARHRRSAPPAGLLINIGGVTVYHAGDTCLFSDMKLIAERNPIDVALLPIGGHYTMDRHDARGRRRVHRRRDGDPDALRHLPADRDRRRRPSRHEVEAKTSSTRGRALDAGGVALGWLTSQAVMESRPMRTTEASSRGPSGSDFQATADPALIEAADRTAEVKLLTYEELYLLWERQQWQTQELDFSRDREDWHERFADEERFQRMYGLSSFFIGEQKVAEELGPIMRAAPTEDQRIFLCTQIADEARHVRFFERFYREVGVLESDELPQMLDADLRAPERELRPPLRRDAEAAHRPALRRARGHRGPGRGGDDLPHGDRGDAGPHRPALHHGLQRKRRDAAGLRRGLPERRPRRASPRRLRLRLPA